MFLLVQVLLRLLFPSSYSIFFLIYFSETALVKFDSVVFPKAGAWEAPLLWFTTVEGPPGPDSIWKITIRLSQSPRD